MAKKSSKHQSKLANTATTDPEITEEPAPTEITAPATSLPVSIPSPSSYKPITDSVSIERLVGLAKDSAPDSALGIVWKHAYEEGYQNGRLALLQNLEKKLDEKYKQGEKEGIKKGKEKYYGKGIVEGESEEYKRWTKAGHNDRCFKSTVIRDDASTQTDAPATATSSVSTQTTFPTTSQARSFVENGVGARLALTAAVSIQTDAIIVTAPFSTSTATQTDSINTISPATTDFFVQTDPISTRESHYVIKHPTSPTLLPATSTSSTTTTGTKTDTTTSQPLKTKCTTCEATSQSPEYSKIEKSRENSLYSEITANLSGFSLQTPSLVVPNPQALSTITPALETRSRTADFAQIFKNTTTSNISPKTTIFSQPTPSITSLNSPALSNITPALRTGQNPTDFTLKVEIFEKSLISTQTTPQTPSRSIIGCADDVTQVRTSPLTPNDVLLQPLALSTTASSLPTPHPLAHQKSALSRAVFELQLSTESTVLTSIVTPFKTCSAPAEFTENCKKVEISPNFTQKPPFLPASESFDWADDAEALYITSTIPQHPPRDLSCLRTTSMHPFSSLRRKRGRPKNRTRQNAQRNYSYTHPFSTTQHLLSHPHTPFHASLNWDQDPRLADLSTSGKTSPDNLQ